MENLAIPAKKWARHANAYVPDALQEGCEILMQILLGSHDFTSLFHPYAAFTVVLMP